MNTFLAEQVRATTSDNKLKSGIISGIRSGSFKRNKCLSATWNQSSNHWFHCRAITCASVLFHEWETLGNCKSWYCKLFQYLVTFEVNRNFYLYLKQFSWEKDAVAFLSWGIFLTLTACDICRQWPFRNFFSTFWLQKLKIRVLFRGKGESSSNCLKFIKICHCLVIPHPCLAFLKYALYLATNIFKHYFLIEKRIFKSTVQNQSKGCLEISVKKSQRSL